MEPSGTGDNSTPLADITNNKNQGVLDRNERRRQRYASMPKEQKDDLNRKKRERRAENKRRAHANTSRDGDQDENNEWLNCGQLTQTNEQPDAGVPLDENEDNDEWLHRGHFTSKNNLTGRPLQMISTLREEKGGCRAVARAPRLYTTAPPPRAGGQNSTQRRRHRERRVVCNGESGRSPEGRMIEREEQRDIRRCFCMRVGRKSRANLGRR